jgi:hypothetical protein
LNPFPETGNEVRMPHTASIHSRGLAHTRRKREKWGKKDTKILFSFSKIKYNLPRVYLSISVLILGT